MVTQSSETNQFEYESAPPAHHRSVVGGLSLAMAGLLIVTVAGTFWAGERVNDYNRQVARTYETIDSLHEISSSYKDAETGERGYLLTGDENYLDPYNRAVSLIPGELDDLYKCADDGLLTESDVNGLRKLGKLKLSELRHAIDLRRSGARPDAGVSVALSGLGKQTMDEIRALIHRMVLQKEQDANNIGRSSQIATYVRSGAFAGTALVNLLFLLWAYRKIRRRNQRSRGGR